VALKFEHKNSKGCNYGPPYEWQVYKYVWDYQTTNRVSIIKGSFVVLCPKISFYAVHSVVAMGYLRFTIRGNKETIMLWYFPHPPPLMF